MHIIWEVAKTGDLDVLGAEERRIAEVMLEHQDEYFNQFEIADVLADHEYDPESETNPFLHVTFHAIVENQLEARDPIEVYQFYNTMRKKRKNIGVGSQHLTFHKKRKNTGGEKHSKEGDKAGPSVFQFLSNPFRDGS